MKNEVIIYYVGPDAHVGWVTGWKRDSGHHIVELYFTLNYQEAFKFNTDSKEYEEVYFKLLHKSGFFNCFKWGV